MGPRQITDPGRGWDTGERGGWRWLRFGWGRAESGWGGWGGMGSWCCCGRKSGDYSGNGFQAADGSGGGKITKFARIGYNSPFSKTSLIFLN